MTINDFNGDKEGDNSQGGREKEEDGVSAVT